MNFICYLFCCLSQLVSLAWWTTVTFLGYENYVGTNCGCWDWHCFDIVEGFVFWLLRPYEQHGDGVVRLVDVDAKAEDQSVTSHSLGL